MILTNCVRLLVYITVNESQRTEREKPKSRVIT